MISLDSNTFYYYLLSVGVSGVSSSVSSSIVGSSSASSRDQEKGRKGGKNEGGKNIEQVPLYWEGWREEGGRKIFF